MALSPTHLTTGPWPPPKHPSQRLQCSQVEARGLGLWAPGRVGHALLAGSWPYNVSCPKRPLKEHSCYTVGGVPGPADSRLCYSCKPCWCQFLCRHRKKGPSRDLLFIQLRLYDQITQTKCSLLPGVVFGYQNKLPCLGDFVFHFCDSGALQTDSEIEVKTLLVYSLNSFLMMNSKSVFIFFRGLQSLP